MHLLLKSLDTHTRVEKSRRTLEKFTEQTRAFHTGLIIAIYEEKCVCRHNNKATDDVTTNDNANVKCDDDDRTESPKCKLKKNLNTLHTH